MEHDHRAYLNAANISATSLKDAVIFLSELAEYIQAPSISLPDQAENGREVVGKHNKTEPTAVNQPRGLEDLVILLSDDSSAALSV